MAMAGERGVCAADLGLGVLWAWMGVVWLGLPRVPQDAGGSRWLLWLCVAGGIALALLAGACVAARGLRPARVRSHAAVLVVALVGAAAQLGMALPPAGGLLREAVRCALGAACGAAASALMLAHAERLAARDADYLELLIPLCSLLSVFTVALEALPGAWYWWLAAALLVLAGAALMRPCRASGDVGSGSGPGPRIASASVPALADTRRRARAELARVGVVTCAAYALIKFAGGSPFDPAYAGSGIWNGVPHLFGVLVAVLIAVLSLSHFRRLTMAAIMKIVSPSLVIATLLILRPEPWCSAVAGILMAVAETPLVVFVTLWALKLARHGLADARVSFGVLMGSAQLGIFLGSLLLAPGDGSGLAAGLGVAVLCGAFACACSLVPSEAREDDHADAAAPVAPAAPPGAAAQARTLDDACAELATQAGLSARELDVLRLLARGYGRAYIRDELVISKNTIATHARHIYQKTGAHSQQELIVLVQGSVSSR